MGRSGNFCCLGPAVTGEGEVTVSCVEVGEGAVVNLHFADKSDGMELVVVAVEEIARLFLDRPEVLPDIVTEPDFRSFR